MPHPVGQQALKSQFLFRNDLLFVDGVLWRFARLTAVWRKGPFPNSFRNSVRRMVAARHVSSPLVVAHTRQGVAWCDRRVAIRHCEWSVSIGSIALALVARWSETTHWDGPCQRDRRCGPRRPSPRVAGGRELRGQPSRSAHQPAFRNGPRSRSVRADAVRVHVGHPKFASLGHELGQAAVSRAGRQIPRRGGDEFDSCEERVERRGQRVRVGRQRTVAAAVGEHVARLGGDAW